MINLPNRISLSVLCMMRQFLSYAILVSCAGFSFVQTGLTQSGGYLQAEVSGGYTSSFRSFADRYNFAGKGWNSGLNLDYFFTRVAMGMEVGYFNNNADKSFSGYIKERYLENNPIIRGNRWDSKYVLTGPVFKLLKGNVELDLIARAGVVQTVLTELEFGRMFSGRYATIYKVTAPRDQWHGAWSGGMRITAKLSENLGIALKANIFSTDRLNRITHLHTYSDATDSNGNGVIDDAEYSESRVVEKEYSSFLYNYNLNAGFIYQIGKSRPKEIIRMIPEYILESDSSTFDVVEMGPDTMDKDSLPPTFVPEPEETVTLNPEEYTAAPDVTDYDELAANFLYKAGQAYFAANDFENAVACFNKLKADVQYPMAKYMFALSLAEMGNCDNAFAEYRDFARQYQGTDAGVLSTVFASHLERCRKPEKQRKTPQESPEPVAEKKPSLNYQHDLKAREVSAKESKKEISVPETEKTDIDKNSTFRIQFIALKKPDYNFPKLYDIGEIRAEYFPEKSMYRYTLGPFYNPGIATDVMLRIRKMGFRDAFVAEYINGVRVNTLHHSK